jgi:type I restriction enzyme M protein
MSNKTVADVPAEESKSGGGAEVLEEGLILDYITQLLVKEAPKELVRQRVARALFHEYGISVDDMLPDFAIPVGGRKKKVDIAIFKTGTAKAVENVRRIVVCRPEPKKNGHKGVTKLRDHDQAEKDLEELKAVMSEAPACEWGLWTNGLEFFFLHKKLSRFDIEFEPIGDWPLADESQGSRDVASAAYTRRADKDMLRVAFRRCHNFIHGNEGMPKDAAFWQFLYLTFCKMHDERQPNRRFWAGPTEQFDPEQRKQIRARVLPLFDEVKKQYPSIFRGNEEITLTDRALAFMVSELAKYDFTRTDIDAKGAAYQEIVGSNLRGDRGQYFTPRGAIKLMVKMLAPKPNERMLDPACGTGGFLVSTLEYMLDTFRQRAGHVAAEEDTQQFLSHVDELRNYAAKYVFGADDDQFLVRASHMNLVMAGSTKVNLFHINSLEFPGGDRPGLEEAQQNIKLGSIDVLMTNPPFGAEIPITDPQILRQYELAHIWERTDDGHFRNTGRVQGSVSPEVLFIERCLRWLRPGGRMGIVLPDGILGNPGDEYIRWWILRNSWVLASVDLPVETFIAEANVNILTSLLFLKRKTDDEVRGEDLGGAIDYPVFMAVAEKVGVDRRGATVYKRSPDGEEIIQEVDESERIRVGGHNVVRTLRRKVKIVDDDLPVIAEKYADFRASNQIPGK